MMFGADVKIPITWPTLLAVQQVEKGLFLPTEVAELESGPMSQALYERQRTSVVSTPCAAQQGDGQRWA